MIVAYATIRVNYIHLLTEIFFKVELNKTLVPWLGKTSKMLGCFINETLATNAIDLTREQWVVLVKVSKHCGLTQNELALITERDKTSLTRLIKTMERKKLIYREVSKNDKRIKLVYISEYGKTAYKKALPIIQNTTQKLQKGLSQQEINNILHTLQKLQTNLTELSTNCGENLKN